MQSIALILGRTSGGGGVPDWIPWAAIVAGLFTVATGIAGRYADRRDRRRDLYAAGYQAALAWVEMLYRVRRRDPERPYPLAEQFHELQEAIDFHQAWIDGESVAFGRAYRRLVMTVKALTVDEIKKAWKAEPCRPEDGFSLEAETHPPIERAKEQFISDLQDHMALNPSGRWNLHDRYDDHNWTAIKAEIARSNPKPKDNP